MIEDAPQERANPGQAARAEDDQIDVQLIGSLHDRVSDRAFVGHPQWPGLEACTASALGTVLRQLPSLVPEFASTPATSVITGSRPPNASPGDLRMMVE